MIITGAIVLASALLAPRPSQVVAASPRTDTVRVVLVVDDTAARGSLVRGAMLGAEEAAHTGALFGTALALRIETRAAFDSARTTAPDPGTAATSIYVVAGDSILCSRVAQQSLRSRAPVLEAGCPAGRDARARTVYSLDARGDSAAATDSTHLALWHSSLERFGAEQLNERFRRRFAAAMDSEAWMGWLAMKIALDLALHAHSASGAALLRQLADPHTAFDGQKGRPLRFDALTHRLTQPLYRVAGSGDSARVVSEVAP